MTEKEFNEFKCFARVYEPSIDFGDTKTKLLAKNAYKIVAMYTKHLRVYLDEEQWGLLRHNIWLHEMIVLPGLPDLYKKYDIESKTMIISSASNAGSSSSIQSFKSLDDGKFMLMDMWRTPYGRLAYSILEGLESLAITLL